MSICHYSCKTGAIDRRPAEGRENPAAGCNRMIYNNKIMEMQVYLMDTISIDTRYPVSV